MVRSMHTWYALYTHGTLNTLMVRSIHHMVRSIHHMVRSIHSWYTQYTHGTLNTPHGTLNTLMVRSIHHMVRSIHHMVRSIHSWYAHALMVSQTECLNVVGVGIVTDSNLLVTITSYHMTVARQQNHIQ